MGGTIEDPKREWKEGRAAALAELKVGRPYLQGPGFDDDELKQRWLKTFGVRHAPGMGCIVVPDPRSHGHNHVIKTWLFHRYGKTAVEAAYR